MIKKEDFKIGRKIEILKEPILWSSHLSKNCPLGKKIYPLTTTIDNVDLKESYGAMSAGGYGWGIDSLIEGNCVRFIEETPKPKFKIGDIVRVLRNEHCGNKVGYVGKITNGTMYSGEKWWMFDTGLYNTESELELVREEECCNSCELNSGDIIKIDNEHGSGSIKNTTEKIMSKVSEFVKNSLLSKEEKLLRKYGLKDSCGDFTGEAERLVISKLVKENEEYLVGVAKDLEAEEKANK